MKHVQLHSIRIAGRLLKAQRKQDRKYHRSIGHLAEFEQQLKAAEASIKKLCDGHKNALLALSVKQIHSGKLIVNKLAALVITLL